MRKIGERFAEAVAGFVVRHDQKICVACADFMARGSPHHEHLCRECAEICEGCAALCERHADPDGTFRPDKQITRAELTAIVVSMFGKDDSAVSPFSDVSRSQWYYGYVATAAKNGWVKGYSGNTFHPVSNITRAEAVTFINGALNRSFDADYGASHYMYLKHFSDVKTTDWFYGQVMEASYGHEYAVSDSGSEVWIGPY